MNEQIISSQRNVKVMCSPTPKLRRVSERIRLSDAFVLPE